MKDIVERCRTYSVEEIINLCEKVMPEQEREKEFLAEITKREMGKGHFWRALNKKEKLKNKEFFQWTQCKNPEYNKYYKKLITDLVTNIDKYYEVYSMLEDVISREIYEEICQWRISRRPVYLVNAFYNSIGEQYFESFENITSNEVFVDCGAYDGDSFRALVRYAGGVRKAILYEADEKNMCSAKIKLKDYKEVTYRNVGVGEKEDILYFNNMGSSSSTFGEGTNGIKMEVVTLDKDIEEKITFLKMDIEGMELEALKGAQGHIKNDRPILAVCLYHNVEDLWKIPLYIKNLVEEDYKFYVRHYTLYHGETVFYAVPNERM